jgi:putative flippase GtrA
MDLRPTAILARFRGKALRYMSVSVLGTIAAQLQIVLYVYGFGWPGALANFVAVTVNCVPFYFLTRAWVWNKRDKTSLHREALPFWMLNLAGLVLSTIFAAIADHFFTQGWVVNIANLAGFGVLWIAKFLILDEYLFKSHPPLVEI